MKETKKLQDFDPNVSPQHEINVKAAKDHKLRYDRLKRAYVDEDGCLIRDWFGQKL